jgi:hypothetical protein
VKKHKRKPVLTEPIQIASWRRNDRQVLRLRLSSYKGRNVVELRAWWDNTNELRPSTDGINLDVSRLPRLCKGFKKALARARKYGLVDPE